jgi:AcrR family transcriptional regulator
VPAATTRRDEIRRSREEMRGRMVDAARDLLRTRSFAELTVDEVMRPTGQGRTVFYRHFDDLGDLLTRASREAIEQLYEAQTELATARGGGDRQTAVRDALTRAVGVFAEHGPLLRAIVEAATVDAQVAADVDALRRRFDDLTAQALTEVAAPGAVSLADVTQTAHALTLMNESYLLDAFGREPRVSAETAVQTLTEVWEAVVGRSAAG